MKFQFGSYLNKTKYEYTLDKGDDLHLKVILQWFKGEQFPKEITFSVLVNASVSGTLKLTQYNVKITIVLHLCG